MTDQETGLAIDDARAAEPETRRSPRHLVLLRLSELSPSAQSAIPGLYAWAITVAPAAWSRGAPTLAKVAAICGVLALATAPLVDGHRGSEPADGTVPMPSAMTEAPGKRRSFVEHLATWTGPRWARVWSVWGFVVSSAAVWTLAPGALASVRFDGIRGALGVVGWALFAFASAGPSLRATPVASPRLVAGSTLKSRAPLARGDGFYVAAGVVLALGMQSIGWDVATPERAVLVRLVTVMCGVAILGGTASLALARHAERVPASRGLRLRRASPWMVILALVVASGFVLTFGR